MKETHAKKLRRIEQLVKEDLTNGRHVQQKLRLRLKANGNLPEEVVEEIKDCQKKE
jgi:hypothetical protein